MSKKRFEGWEPFTEYVYEDPPPGPVRRPGVWAALIFVWAWLVAACRRHQLQLVASRPETEWDAEQRGWVLALAVFRNSRCPCGCGHNVADSTGQEVPGMFRAQRVRCHARAALDLAQAQAPNKPEDLPGARIWWTDKVR